MPVDSMNTEDLPPDIGISDTEIWEKNKRFIVYKLAVSSGTSSWFLFRRYNEFNALYEKVKKICPEAHLKLPGKRLFGNFDPLFIRQRRNGLYDFVQKLMMNPSLRHNDHVVDFFKLDCLKHSSSEDDDEDGLDSPRPCCSEVTVVNLGPSEKPQCNKCMKYLEQRTTTIDKVRPGDFEFLKVIGKGSYGKVLLAKHKSEGCLYAVKVLNKSHIMKRNEAQHIMSERNVLVTNVEHPFLVALRYSFQTPNKLYFVLDYVNGGELFFHLQRERCFSEARSRFYAAEIASALGYLHSLSIIYRDLKPENILLDSQGHVVLTDFGLCKEGINGRDTTSTFCGTPEYLAPEVLLKKPYDKTVDWWCLGAVLYEMIFGLPPFYSRDTSEMYDHILHQPLHFRGAASSSVTKSFLDGLLQKNRERRLGANGDFSEVSKHAFFSPINWTLLNSKKLKPLYNPNLNGQMDLKHFDPEFVREPIPDSIGHPGGMSGVQSTDHAFDGFSYVMPAFSS